MKEVYVSDGSAAVLRQLVIPHRIAVRGRRAKNGRSELHEFSLVFRANLPLLVNCPVCGVKLKINLRWVLRKNNAYHR